VPSITRHEDFIGFVDVHHATFEPSTADKEPTVNGKVIGQLVLSLSGEMGLNLLDCVVIGTDGCAMMVSNNCGAVIEIQKKKLKMRLVVLALTTP